MPKGLRFYIGIDLILPTMVQLHTMILYTVQVLAYKTEERSLAKIQFYLMKIRVYSYMEIRFTYKALGEPKKM